MVSTSYNTIIRACREDLKVYLCVFFSLCVFAYMYVMGDPSHLTLTQRGGVFVGCEFRVFLSCHTVAYMLGECIMRRSHV